ncbi:hypothetical protein D8674_009191 [Pyrus ussuriensis x Pyrus communis]|uniref:Uncharacterized protein n=1 Tax=Pyrus ussuriensis x Pyrus communis TaxID=2448454 RepID=A0A5N5HZW8_9ROSA|nr:hypothetical protein D8674_009191 [Pyrus ussuriensis x Pyrus communis]
MQKNKGRQRGGGPFTRRTDNKEENTDTHFQKMDLRNIAKEIELLGTSNMTWKERKELENRRVVSLGGKPQKNRRLPLSVAKLVMKNQKKREQKLQEQNMVLGRFGGNSSGSSKRSTERKRPENRGLKGSEGHFKNGVLDVKHLLRPTSSAGPSMLRGKTKGKRKNNTGKKIGGMD